MKKLREIANFYKSHEYAKELFSGIKSDQEILAQHKFSKYSAENVMEHYAQRRILVEKCESIIEIIDRCDWSYDEDELLESFAATANRFNEYSPESINAIKLEISDCISLREFYDESTGD